MNEPEYGAAHRRARAVLTAEAPHVVFHETEFIALWQCPQCLLVDGSSALEPPECNHKGVINDAAPAPMTRVRFYGGLRE